MATKLKKRPTSRPVSCIGVIYTAIQGGKGLLHWIAESSLFGIILQPDLLFIKVY